MPDLATRQNDSAMVILDRLGRELPHVRFRLIPFAGIASSESRDQDGEIINQSGLDWSYFLRHGRIIDNHGHSSGDVIGHPTKVELIKLPNGRQATWIEGYLYETPSTRQIVEAIRTAQAAGRPYGLSIEATRPERRGDVIERAKVINVAVTPYAVNTDTMMMVLKSFARQKGLEFGEPQPGAVADGAALARQSLEQRVAVATVGGDVMAEEALAQSMQEFLSRLSPEELAALKQALGASGGEEGEGAPETAQVGAAPGLEEPEKKAEEYEIPEENPAEESETVEGEEQFEEEKGLKEIGEGVSPEVIDATQFLEAFANQTLGDLTGIKETLAAITQRLDQLEQAINGQVSEFGEQLKSLRKDLEGSPAAIKGVALGSPNNDSAQAIADEEARKAARDPAIIKGRLMAVAQDPTMPLTTRNEAALIAARMDFGYVPPPERLARLGLKEV